MVKEGRQELCKRLAVGAAKAAVARQVVAVVAAPMA